MTHPEPPSPTPQAGHEPQGAGEWVLVGRYLDTGLPKYHAQDMAIGPRSTPNRDEAQRFASREEACQSSGFRHWSSNSKPVLLSEARVFLSEDGKIHLRPAGGEG